MAEFGIPVLENADVPVGQILRFVIDRDELHVHPLDLIAIETPAALERLDRAMDWLLRRALNRLDIAILFGVGSYPDFGTSD